jgi:hypothetical protein
VVWHARPLFSLEFLSRTVNTNVRGANISVNPNVHEVRGAKGAPSGRVTTTKSCCCHVQALDSKP